jgi:hypothetical protein
MRSSIPPITAGDTSGFIPEETIMNVGNNRPVGPRPSEVKQGHLDPDLTRVNRDGVEYTTERASELASTAREEAAAERQETARGDLSRETVELSPESRRLAADELPGPGSRRESAEAREARLDSLLEAHEKGELNSPERLREAAGRLLGGE